MFYNDNHLIMKKILFAFFAISCLFVACDQEDPMETPATYDPTPYDLKIGDFPVTWVCVKQQTERSRRTTGADAFLRKIAFERRFASLC